MSKSPARLIVTLLLAAAVALAQSPDPTPVFEVATIKPTPPDWTSGRFIRLQGDQFIARNHALKTLIAAAYNVFPGAISGGPAWVDSDRYDILAKTPGEGQPSLDQQMSMLAKLLGDRFKLTFHREQKTLSYYALTIDRNGPKLEPATESPGDRVPLIFVISPQNARLPGRNASMAELASVMQRAALDRPVVNKTGLSGRYDFDLEWVPDETQFTGIVPPGTGAPSKPDLFAALPQQLGLKLEATRGPIEVLVIDRVERPSEN